MEPSGRPLPAAEGLPSTARGPRPTADSRQPTLQWIFHCSGPKKARLEEAVAGLPAAVRDRIRVGGSLEPGEWERAMREAEVALVTLVPGAEKVVMPSKVYSAMMAGQAVLAVAPEDSDLADVIKAAGCGWRVAPGDVEGLRERVEVIRSDPQGVAEKGRQARRVAEAQFSPEILAGKWRELFGGME